MKSLKLKLILIVSILILLLVVIGCASDPVDWLAIRDVQAPSLGDSYVGSSTNPFTYGYFDNLTLAGVPLGGGVGDMTKAVYDPANIGEQLVGLTSAQNLTNKNITMLNSVPIYWDDTLGVDMNVLQVWADDNLHIFDGEAHSVFMWLGAGTGQTMYFWPTSSSAISTLKDSPTLDFIANYWNAGNANWEAKIIHNMITAGAAPKSRLEFEIQGEDILRLENNNTAVMAYFDGVLDMTTHNIINVADPINPQDAATMNYVDTEIAGIPSGGAFLDDIALTFGTGLDVSILYETADANANELILGLPTGGATDVPVFAIGDASIVNKDLTFFNGITVPTLAILDASETNRLVLDGTPAIKSNTSIQLKPSGDLDDYLTFTTVSNIPTIYGTGAYVRIGDAGTTGHSLASEDDLMVSGKLEVDGESYHDENLVIADDRSLMLGSNFPDVYFVYSTDDPNAKILKIQLPDTNADSNNVPVIVFSDIYTLNFNNGLFDGITQPLLVVLGKDDKLHTATDGIANDGGATAELNHVGGFTNAVVGDIVRITAGTLCTTGWYWITTKTSNDVVVLDRNYTSGNTTNVTFVTYHNFPMIGADGVCLKVFDGAPTDSNTEIDRDGWLQLDAGNNLLYGRSQSTWLHWTPDTGAPTFASITYTSPTELTINAGAITITQGFHTVDTQADDATDDLDTINGGATGQILILSASNDAREVKVTRNGNIRFQPEHMIEGFSFASPSGTSGTFYTGGYYASPATDANLTQASTTITYGTANSPYGAHAFLVAAAAGTTDVGTVSIVVSGTSVTSAGVRTPGATETIVTNITTMAANSYYQTAKKWLGQITYTLTPAGGAANYAADFNYGLVAYDSFDERLHTIKLIEVMGRAGANDTGFDIQLLHHKSTGWTYSAAAFVPGTTPIASLVTDYSTDNDLVINERFKWEREVSTYVTGTTTEGFLVRVITTANKAVEFMNISVYAEVIPNDQHLNNTNQSIQLIYNGTNWMEQ